MYNNGGADSDNQLIAALKVNTFVFVLCCRCSLMHLCCTSVQLYMYITLFSWHAILSKHSCIIWAYGVMGLWAIYCAQSLSALLLLFLFQLHFLGMFCDYFSSWQNKYTYVIYFILFEMKYIYMYIMVQPNSCVI